ncbi:MAG: DUF370 domain-containing protein [Selenomonadaceae bacterium]|nr:DUF370 domain-containing protein [Selenomonadaceae bacterium]
MIGIGFGNSVRLSGVDAVVNPDSAPVKRMIQESRDAGRLVDATQGRKTRSVIVMSSGAVVLSALQPETITQRANNE